MATSTPWGPSQDSRKYGRGVTFYSTAGHGGFKVCPTLNAAMPAHLRREDGWYEEDCDYARVMIAFLDRFTTGDAESAEAALRNWAPAAWEAHYGRALGPGESHMRDRETFNAEHVDHYVTVAAWGDWHETVPEGFVGVCARRARDRHEVYALVTTADYEERGQCGYVLTTDQVGTWIGPDGRGESR